MTESFTTRLNAPHALIETKDPRFDADRHIALTEPVVNGFATAMNAAFAKPETRALLEGARAYQFADIITQDREFPFMAMVIDGAVVLTGDLTKHAAPVVKDISNGVTSINQSFVRATKPGEWVKFALGTLFQAATYDAYLAAGMTEGPHTKFTARCC